MASATNIGYKRILRFGDVTTHKLRVRILERRLSPVIQSISAHYYHSKPPRLVAERNIEGMLTIKPFQEEFNWKVNKEDLAKNMHKGLKIYYTTDGSTPNAASKLYTAPFLMNKGTVKAVPIINNEEGVVLEEQLGYIKKGWSLLNATNEATQVAFDEDVNTNYTFSKSENGALTIDLGEKRTLTGFAYVPPKNMSKGMMSKGLVKTSNDAQNWKEEGIFEFANLINDPSKRKHFLGSVAEARYLKIEVLETTENTDNVVIAELDIF